MKKIGLAIVYDYPDYGSMLQALATQLTVERLGYEPLALNTARLKGDIAKRKYRYFASNVFDLSIVKEKSKIVGKKLRKLIDKGFASRHAMRVRAFEAFNRRYFKETRPFESWQDMAEACRDYDAVVVGSDQLWLPSNVAADYYTLSWVPDEVRRVCYATSFGIGAVPAKYAALYRRFLSRINFLSARETSGQKIIRDLTGRDVPLVCDPALLLDADAWDAIATPGRLVSDKYVFCYFMGDNPEQRDFARRLADSHGCRVVSLLHLDQYIPSDEHYADSAPYDVSPADFINLVKNAEYVCTDSFHGTVFSVIYHRDFFTFKRFNKKASLSTNTRIFSLLDRLGLADRLFTAQEDPTADWHIADYDKIDAVVADFRASSLKYLTDALGRQSEL